MWCDKHQTECRELILCQSTQTQSCTVELNVKENQVWSINEGTLRQNIHVEFLLQTLERYALFLQGTDLLALLVSLASLVFSYRAAPPVSYCCSSAVQGVLKIEGSSE